MSSKQNPEEGRISKERAAELLRESRKKTAEMKREYRTMRRAQEAELKAKRWAERHKAQHTDTYDDLTRVSTPLKPLNRRERRHFAKRMNVFKTPQGWQHFNNNYIQKYGLREPRVKGAATEARKVESNITQALAAAKVTKKEDN